MIPALSDFVNVKNGAEYIDTDDLLFTFETCAMTDDEILSKVTSIEEDEENCQDTDEIEDC